MAISRRFLLKVFKEAAKKAPHRKDGYDLELKDIVTNIIMHESYHMANGGNINQKIKDEISNLVITLLAFTPSVLLSISNFCLYESNNSLMNSS